MASHGPLFAFILWILMPGKVVLVVDDEPSVRRIVKTILQREGFQTLEAGSGSEALDLIQVVGSDIDLLLTDIVMPRMDGISLAESFWELFPLVPVLFMSGFISSGPFHEPMERYALLDKPFTPETLIKAIHELMA